jgi:hypothetical protein
MKRQRRELSAACFLGCALAATIACFWVVTPAHSAVVSDSFDSNFNYALGAVGGIWNGSENMLNLNGGLYNANISNPGTLTVDDNGTFDADGDPANGISGSGWEGGRSTAPFLYTNVPAGQDFTATVKVSAQTSGQWSAAGIIARAANSPTPPGIGANHTDENFVTTTTFRTDAANVNEGNTLNKRIEAGAQVNDNNIGINATGTEPLPLHVRLQRVAGGTTYRTWVSTDGGANYQFQSRVRPTAGNALRDPAVGMQVGLGYMNFGTLAGTTQFDDFVLDTHDPLPAPGAPNLTSSQTSFTVARGTVLQQLITDTTGQGLLSWVRTPNLPGGDAMLPGTNGGPPSAQVPVPPPSGSYFRWDTLAPVGNYMVTINASNDWGQESNAIVLNITIVPEPTSIALVGMAILGLLTSSRRRR